MPPRTINSPPAATAKIPVEGSPASSSESPGGAKSGVTSRPAVAGVDRDRDDDHPEQDRQPGAGRLDVGPDGEAGGDHGGGDDRDAVAGGDHRVVGEVDLGAVEVELRLRQERTDDGDDAPRTQRITGSALSGRSAAGGAAVLAGRWPALTGAAAAAVPVAGCGDVAAALLGGRLGRGLRLAPAGMSGGDLGLRLRGRVSVPQPLPVQ